MEIINLEFGKKYLLYINIIRKGYYYQNSKIQHNLNDILHDVYIELIERFDSKELVKKIKIIPRKHKVETTLFDGLIIRMVNLNLVSKTSRYYKTYHDDKLVYCDKFSEFYFKNNVSEYDDRIDYIEEVLNSVKIKYKYKKELFKERWGINTTSIKKKTYKELAEKYKISLSYVRMYIMEVEALIIEKINKDI